MKTEVETIAGQAPREGLGEYPRGARRRHLAGQRRTFWEREAGRILGAANAALLVVYAVCLFLFFALGSSSDPGLSRFEYRIGAPMPWYTFEIVSENHFTLLLHFRSTAWLAAAAAFGALALRNWLRIRCGKRSAGRTNCPSMP